jgi:hypothetical protein
MMFPFNMLGLGDPLGGEGCGVMQYFVSNVALVQAVDKFFRYFHRTKM